MGVQVTHIIPFIKEGMKKSNKITHLPIKFICTCNCIAKIGHYRNFRKAPGNHFARTRTASRKFQEK
jgi:hypothetical protein